MQSQDLADSQWERLRELVPGGRRGKRGPRSDGRQFLNALLWMARSGARWRDLPERYGNVHTVKARDYRWLRADHIDRLFHAVVKDPDLEWVAVETPVIRSHTAAIARNSAPAGISACVRQSKPRVWTRRRPEARTLLGAGGRRPQARKVPRGLGKREKAPRPKGECWA